MTDVYDDMRGVVDELLGEFKQGTVQLKRTTTAEPDPATPWIPGEETTASYPLDAARRPALRERCADCSDRRHRDVRGAGHHSTVDRYSRD